MNFNPNKYLQELHDNIEDISDWDGPIRTPKQNLQFSKEALIRYSKLLKTYSDRLLKAAEGAALIENRDAVCAEHVKKAPRLIHDADCRNISNGWASSSETDD